MGSSAEKKYVVRACVPGRFPPPWSVEEEAAPTIGALAPTCGDKLGNATKQDAAIVETATEYAVSIMTPGA